MAWRQVLNSRSPAAQYVITPDWFYNWFCAVNLPKFIVDKEIARRFSLRYEALLSPCFHSLLLCLPSKFYCLRLKEVPHYLTVSVQCLM